MGIKSITSLALAAAAVACLSVAPAQANNNDKYMNQLAMQMYLQNESSAYNPAYNPYAFGNNGYGYGYAYNGQTPWSAGAMPYAPNGGNVYYRGYTPRAVYHHRWWR
jgi:hypothetical protein